MNLFKATENNKIVAAHRCTARPLGRMDMRWRNDPHPEELPTDGFEAMLAKENTNFLEDMRASGGAGRLMYS